eukprot:4631284-Prymnesium_polylepis.1
MDCLRVAAPWMRLFVACTLFVYLALELSSRSGDHLIEEEHAAQTSMHALNSYLGGTAQSFIKTLDNTVLLLLATSFSASLLRPKACASITYNASLPDVLFFYGVENRTRKLL